MIKLYIITVHLNNGSAFLRTSNSVRATGLLSTDWCKWIIKDGGSLPSHLNVLEREIQTFSEDSTIFTSSKDGGIYDAMNQAINLLGNEEALCLFLNAGDYFAGNISDKLIKCLEDSSNKDIVYFDHIQSGKSTSIICKSPQKLDFAFLLGKTVNHQSLLMRVKWLKKYFFEVKYTVVADWVQLFSILRNEQVSAGYFEFPLVVYEGGGFSAQNDSLRLHQRQMYLQSIYSDWELESLTVLSRIRSRSWFTLINRSLESPKRSWLLSLLSRLI